MSGDHQTAAVGTPLSLPLVVKVTTANGSPKQGHVVRFVVASGGGSLATAVDTTDAQGLAQDLWTLGTTVSDTQRVRVRTWSPQNNDSVTVGTFSASVVAGPPARIAKAAGDSQTAAVGHPVAIRPAVRVEDQYGNPIPDVGVTFSALHRGNASGRNTHTDAHGTATAGGWTVGMSAGRDTLTARADGDGIAGNPATFTATVTGSSSAACDCWTTRAPMNFARGAAGIAAANGKLYVIGGDPSAAFGPSAIVEEYDPATNHWTTKASMPTARRDLAAATVNGIIYAVGGRAEFSTSLATLEAYDPATNTWTTKAPMPTARHFASFVAQGGLLYAFGGMHDGFTDNVSAVEVYDPATNSWSTKTPMPDPRYGMGAAAMSGAVYLIGGNGGTGEPSSAVAAYNTATSSWSRKGYEPGHGFVGAGAVNNRIYAVGETRNDAYDPITDTWSSKTAMPTPRSFAGVTANNGIVYVAGGYRAGAPSNVLEAYQP